jgi:hypothetical protein
MCLRLDIYLRQTESDRGDPRSGPYFLAVACGEVMKSTYVLVMYNGRRIKQLMVGLLIISALSHFSVRQSLKAHACRSLLSSIDC